jgi:hypothetical protein
MHIAGEYASYLKSLARSLTTSTRIFDTMLADGMPKSEKSLNPLFTN